ncbi:MAG TPA: hypothetical protein VI503_07225, partial [Gaiellaceae bacterium]|nr:hypothetical protein [Gaiellaceae bacterium]
MLRVYWHRVSRTKRIVLTLWFLIVLLSAVIGGWGLLIGGLAALTSAVLLAVIWAASSRVGTQRAIGF